MSILNNIIKTAKELYEADENGNLGDYVNDRISTITNKLDGTEDMIRESEYDDILNLLDENFDIDQFQCKHLSFQKMRKNAKMRCRSYRL